MVFFTLSYSSSSSSFSYPIFTWMTYKYSVSLLLRAYGTKVPRTDPKARIDDTFKSQVYKM